MEATYEDTRQRLADAAVWQRHGLATTSFSTIDLASNLTGLILKINQVARDAAGTMAMVGNWTEAGVAAGIAVSRDSNTGQPLEIEQAVDGAIDRLSYDTALEPENTRKRALKNTPSRIRTGIRCLEGFGPPEMVDHWQPYSTSWKDQVPINFQPEYSPVPIRGFLDFLYPKPRHYTGPLPLNEGWQGQPLIVDTKAPNAFKVLQDGDTAMARGMVESYMRQGAIYRAATGCNFATLILHPDQVQGAASRGDQTFTPRFEWIELTPEREAVAIAQVRAQIAQITKFLSLGESAEELAEYVTPDKGHWKFQGPRAQAAIADLWQ